MVQVKQHILKKSKRIVYPLGAETAQGYLNVVVPFTEAELAHAKRNQMGQIQKKGHILTVRRGNIKEVVA